jgi:hypothetical protein
MEKGSCCGGGGGDRGSGGASLQPLRAYYSTDVLDYKRVKEPTDIGRHILIDEQPHVREQLPSTLPALALFLEVNSGVDVFVGQARVLALDLFFVVSRLLEAPDGFGRNPCAGESLDGAW